ncbi:MAG: HD domain-containing protein [Patescibacteria group bacterium]
MEPLKRLPEEELHKCFLATQGCLRELRTETSHRRHSRPVDFHSIGDPFVRDFSAIMLSRAWRRMAGKKQIASPLISRVRDRDSHTCEVMGNSLRIAEHLGLNTYLTLAIAAGHDIGHVPFGHQGEKYLRVRGLGPTFSHEKMSVIVAQHVERHGEGLNLTHAVLDGMFRHSGKNVVSTMTQESWVVRWTDKITYNFADYDDFQRLRLECDPELYDLADMFGRNHRERTFRTIVGLCEESSDERRVSFKASLIAAHFDRFRNLMYREYVKIAEQNVSEYLDPIYDVLERNKCIPPALGIALLTDEEVYDLAALKRTLTKRDIMATGLGGVIFKTPREVLKNVDMTALDLDW